MLFGLVSNLKKNYYTFTFAVILYFGKIKKLHKTSDKTILVRIAPVPFFSIIFFYNSIFKFLKIKNAI